MILTRPSQGCGYRRSTTTQTPTGTAGPPCKGTGTLRCFFREPYHSLQAYRQSLWVDIYPYVPQKSALWPLRLTNTTSRNLDIGSPRLGSISLDLSSRVLSTDIESTSVRQRVSIDRPRPSLYLTDSSYRRETRNGQLGQTTLEISALTTLICFTC